jgi:hypothetical protein
MFIAVAHEGGLQLMGVSIMPLEAGSPAVVRVREDPVMVASLEKTGLQLPALVCCDLLGATETSNPDGDKL